MEYFGQEIGAEAGVLYDNSTNIVQLIRNTYEVCQHILLFTFGKNFAAKCL